MRAGASVIIPSSFAPVSKEAKFASEQTAKKKGAADLHSMAAWENVFILKEVMEQAKISGAELRRARTAGRKTSDAEARATSSCATTCSR